MWTTGQSPLASITITSPSDFAIGEFGLFAVKGAGTCTNGFAQHLLVAKTVSVGQISGVFCLNPQGIGTYTQNGLVAPGQIITAGAMRWFSATGNTLRNSGYVNGAASSFAQTKPVAASGSSSR